MTTVNDAKRLEVLQDSGLLNSLPEEEFDRVTRLASRLLNTPVALVSLVDAQRQFFKSQVGLPLPYAQTRETPLSHSFCQIVVNEDQPLLVTNSADDERVAGNGAIEDLGVVAYCGVPLRTSEGFVLGALCAIDSQERNWTAQELSALEDLAALVMTEIALRKSLEREHATRVEREAVARSLQRALLPPADPRIPGADVATAYLPQSRGDMVGGDFFDVFEPAENEWHVVVGDVCGKGPLAAQTSLVVRSIVRAAAMRGEMEDDIFASVDRAIDEGGHPFVAMSYLVVRCEDDQMHCRLTLAGQPRSIVFGDGEARCEGVYGSLLGLGIGPLKLQAVEFSLKPGQFLALFTDGVTDQPGLSFEDHKLVTLLDDHDQLSAADMVDQLVTLARSSTSAAGETADDIAVVALGPIS